MTKLQRITLILAAFGVISILLTQTQSYSISKNETLPATSQQTVSINNVHVNSDYSAQEASDKVSAAQVITNIYQSGTGSFYFERAAEHEQSSIIHEASTLQSTHAEITVTGPIARTRLTQVFANSSDQLSSGVYVFPLPQDAAVDHLLMQVGERKIEGLIKPRNQALSMFNDAKAKGQNASLVSQIRPNMFSNRIANIAPHSEITVTIEYQQFIVQDQYNFALRLPLSITPRYSPAVLIKNDLSQLSNMHENNLAARSTNGQIETSQTTYLPAKTTISVRLNTGLPVRQINSLHHPIKTTNPHTTEYFIELDTDSPKNEDFVLQWQLRPGYNVQASHFTYQADNYEYGLITLLPPANDTLRAKRNIVFILDVSGSMVGEAITQAKQALAMAIQDLQKGDYFNLIAFSSHATRLWPSSQAASFAAKDEALSYIYGLEANGGTEIKKALNMAFSLPTMTRNLKDTEEASADNHYLNQIVFITDGSVSNEDELLRSIYRDLGQYRLFTVGIGHAPNAYFMSEAAAAGKGSFTYIGDVNQVQPNMQKLLEKLKRPALTDIELTTKDAQQAFAYEFYPSIVPDLYAGEPLVISYRKQIKDYSTTTTLPFSLQGQYLAQTAAGAMLPRKWSSQLPSITAQREQGIHKYWARLKIKELQQQLNMPKPFSEGYEVVKKNIELAITNIAVDHHLVSQYTSLVAIDHAPPSPHAEHLVMANTDTGNLNQYALGQLPQTATPSALMALLGGVLITLSGGVLWRHRKEKTLYGIQ